MRFRKIKYKNLKPLQNYAYDCGQSESEVLDSGWIQGQWYEQKALPYVNMEQVPELAEQMVWIK